MIDCGTCGKEIKETVRSCPHCGAASDREASDRNEVVKLAEKAMRDDDSVWGEIYEKTHRYVFYLSLKTLHDEQDAQDITQEVYIKAIDSISQLQNADSFFAWLRSIIFSKCKDLVKKKKPILLDENEDGDSPLDDMQEENEEFLPERVLDSSETRRMVLELVDELPWLQRQTVMFFYYDEMAVDQIATLMECASGTVKSRLNYARQSIKRGVEEHERKGVKLYGVGVLPILTILLREEARNLLIPEALAGGLGAILSAVGTTGAAAGSATGAAAGSATGAAAGSATGATATGAAGAAEAGAVAGTAGVAGSAVTVGAAGGAATTATTAGTAISAKIIAGVIAAAVLVGGGVMLLTNTPVVDIEPPSSPPPITSPETTETATPAPPPPEQNDAIAIVPPPEQNIEEEDDEDTRELVSTVLTVIYNPNEYRDKFEAYTELYDSDSAGTFRTGIWVYGVRFSDPIFFDGVSVSEAHLRYGDSIVQELKDSGFATQMDSSGFWGWNPEYINVPLKVTGYIQPSERGGVEIVEFNDDFHPNYLFYPNGAFEFTIISAEIEH